MSDTEQMEVQAEATATKSKTKQVDVITATAMEVGKLTKDKALGLAATLANSIETDYLRLGGVLKVIKDNAWFDGYADFETFVLENYGFQQRKAFYLIEIYDALVDKQIPWEKVAGLGWTKLKDLAKHLTPENVDEWVEKASKLTVSELQQLLKGTGDAEKGGTVSTTSTMQTMKFVLVNDQIETVKAALAKVKAEVNTEHDNAALETLCSGYLSGTFGSAKPDLKTFIQSVDPMDLLNAFAEVHPQINLEVQM